MIARLRKQTIFETPEAGILYQNGNCWLIKTGKTYEVCVLDVTAGRVVDRIGVSYPDALNRAKRTVDRREEQRRLTTQLRK